MDPSTPQQLCEYLTSIATLLEGGDSEAAAAVMAKMRVLLPQLPMDVPDDQFLEAQRLLERCSELEASLRLRIVASLKELGARRRGMAYRHGAPRP